MTSHTGETDQKQADKRRLHAVDRIHLRLVLRPVESLTPSLHVFLHVLLILPQTFDALKAVRIGSAFGFGGFETRQGKNVKGPDLKF